MDLRFVDQLVDFVRGKGFVLDFSDATFPEFFTQELRVDIDDPMYAKMGSSKGKRLRCFLQTVDNKTAINALQALWQYRADLVALNELEDPIPNAEARLLTIVQRLSGSANASLVAPPAKVYSAQQFLDLKRDLERVRDLPPHPRGTAFEGFLKRAFDVFGLAARDQFKIRHEQIDGSFVLGHETYLLEAKWHKGRIDAATLRIFQAKLEAMSAWTRGVFVSFNGFTVPGLNSFGGGKRLICVEGKDIHSSFVHEVPLDIMLQKKARHLAETGEAFIPFALLFPEKRVGP